MNRKYPQQGPARTRTGFLSLSLSLPPIFYSLHLSQREGSELTKCQLTLNVWPLRFPPGAADSDGVWVNTEGLQRIIILLLRPPPPFLHLLPSSIPLFCFQWGGFTVQCTFKGWYKMTFQRISFEAVERGRVGVAIAVGRSVKGQQSKKIFRQTTKASFIVVFGMHFGFEQKTITKEWID